MPAIRTWTDDQLIQCVKSNIGLSGVIRDLGLSRSPGNRRTVQNKINELSIDTSHFKGMAHGTSVQKNKIPIDELITNDSRFSSSFVRPKLIKAGLLNEFCYECGVGPRWNNKKLVLQLDHINGDSFDNRIENLRILCPNCHSQTPTYKSKKRSRYNTEL